MWGAVARYGAQAILWLGTASTGWFLSDWFNESSTTSQLASATGQVAGASQVSWWNQKRIFALVLGIVAMVIWMRRGKNTK